LPAGCEPQARRTALVSPAAQAQARSLDTVDQFGRGPVADLEFRRNVGRLTSAVTANDRHRFEVGQK
jgi:hypothetical protein